MNKSTKKEYIVNLTCEEYFVSVNDNYREEKLKLLLKPNTEETAINEDDVGFSRWNKNDNIKLIKYRKNKKLCEYVGKNYSNVFYVSTYW